MSEHQRQYEADTQQDISELIGRLEEMRRVNKEEDDAEYTDIELTATYNYEPTY